MTTRIPYYSVRRRNGRSLGYWQPTPTMKAAGFEPVPCGKDGPEAWAIAASWNERWQQHRATGAKRDYDRPRLGYVYFLKVGDRLKIGFSTKPQERVAELSTAIAEPIDMLMVVRGTQADERKLHRHLASEHHRGEWFVASPAVMRVAMRSLMFGRPMYREAEGAEERSGTKSLTALKRTV